jgi:hypothetical protein
MHLGNDREHLEVVLSEPVVAPRHGDRPDRVRALDQADGQVQLVSGILDRQIRERRRMFGMSPTFRRRSD